MSAARPTRCVVQFGTSRFLQAHADLFIHEARAEGQEAGPVTVVQTSGDAARAGRVAAFGSPGGYPVIGVVTDDDVDKIAQARPGQTVRLHWSRPRRPFED